MTPAVGNAGALIGHRMGKYELVALLALGGTAEIYLARIGGVAGFEKYVVVKCLHDHLADDSEFVRMFLDEARLTAQLDHSNIVQTIELGEEQGRYYIVMEYLAGMSMSLVARRAIERVPGARMPVDLSLCLAAQACAGLHYAHQRTDMAGNPLNIVHRDVSPQNLVISFEGIVKLVDFGIAKAEMRDTATRTGTIKGKFAYMSPEQCKAGLVDHRTDVFAMGVVVHELLTGKRLFKRSSTYDTYKAIVEGRVPAPSEVNHELDPALDEVVMKALAHDREQRYASAEAFGEALARALHRRGQAVSAGLVASFFEQDLGKEMREHTERMRALIAGRQPPIDEQWDEPDVSSDAGRASQSFERPVSSSGLGMMATVLSSNDIDGEATRIDFNPMLEPMPGTTPAPILAEDEQLTMARESDSQRRSGILPLPRDPDSQRRSGILPLPPEPETESETLLGGDLAPSGGARRPSSSDLRRDRATPLPLRAVDQAGQRDHAAAQSTLSMSHLQDDAGGRPASPVPTPPQLPDAGAPARGRPRAPDDFGAKTAPAGPQGLRGRSPEPTGAGDDVTPAAGVSAGAHASQIAQVAPPSPRPVEYPTSGAMDRLSSSMMHRLGSGPQNRLGSGPMKRANAAQLRPGERTVPVWFLVVLFAISAGVGLGATLLIHALL